MFGGRCSLPFQPAPSTKPLEYLHSGSLDTMAPYHAITSSRSRAVQEALRPTDVVLNFGAWLQNSDPSCGTTENDGVCPHMPWLCDFLKREHTFRTWWLTATPRVENGTVILDGIPATHHLNVPARCQLRPFQVLDRKAVINILQPDPQRQHELWWDAVHMHADANHGFNRQFLSRMPEADAKAPEEQHQRSIWKQMFARGR